MDTGGIKMPVSPSNKADPLSAAKRDVERAIDALEAMRQAPDLGTLELAWRGVLTSLDQSWNKLEDGGRKAFGSRFPPWLGFRSRPRTTDPLLAYLMQARNAAEHTIEEVLQVEPGALGMSFPSGSGHIEELVIDRGGRVVHYNGDPALWHVVPPRLVLLAVENRGRRYEPPLEHLGKKLADANPFAIAAEGIRYYRNLILEAEREFVK